MSVLDEIWELELRLQSAEVRTNLNELDGLLHDSYIEIGISGKRYSKNDILERLPIEKPIGTIRSTAFAMDEIAQGILLLTYQSVRVRSNGDIDSLANRTSLWVNTDNGWQLRFHQGTPTGG